MNEWKKHDGHVPEDGWTENKMRMLVNGKWEKYKAYVLSEVVAEPVTFSSTEPFAISQWNNEKTWDGTLYYSTDGTTWSEWDGTRIESGEHNGTQCLIIRGSGNTYITGKNDISESCNSGWLLHMTDGTIRCDGNIETLLDYETVAAGKHPTMGDYCYGNLFNSWSRLVSAPKLPAVSLTRRCYELLFGNCTRLTEAPELPATVLDYGCYCMMFYGCESITKAPKLPATIMKGHCYSGMFWGTSITEAPELPSTRLATFCYMNMFYDCAKLVKAPELPAMTVYSGAYAEMFANCTSLVTPPRLPATTIYMSGYFCMFYGCTSLAVLPELPATTLTSKCYVSMFEGCTNIKLSETRTGEYQTEYRIPKSGEGVLDVGYPDMEKATGDMFLRTGGTRTGLVWMNTVYYTSNPVI